MKFLVLAACVAVAAGQGFYGLQAHPNGAVTPLDEPAVAARKAEHLATKFGTPLYNNYYGYNNLGYNNYYNGYAAGYGYAAYAPASFYGLQAHPNGAVVPVDEPAVAAARAEHLAAKADAYAVAAPVAVAAAPAVSYAAAPVAVAAAPAVAEVAYTAAPAVSYAAAPVAVAAAPAVAEVAYTAAAPVAVAAAPAPYAGPLHLPTLVSHPNGAVTPADEPAVVAARANHLANFAGVYGGVYAAAGVPAAVGYAAGYPTGLVAHPNGAVVPVDEPAVAAARAEHLAALGQVVY